MRGRVLIAGVSDCSGASGVQADVKTVTALGGYAAAAVTAVIARDTARASGVVDIAPEFVRQQMRLTFDDIGADAIKTGMLHKAETINAVAGEIEVHGQGVPLVVDPVIETLGGPALDAEAVAALKRRLIVMATIITPNIAQGEVLSGQLIPDLETMKHAAATMLTLGSAAVLLTGGDMNGDEICDVLATADGVELFHSRRIETRNLAGTGPTIASAIAAGLAQGLSLRPAVQRARAYVRRAIETAPGLGSGVGPINHAHTMAPFAG